MAIAFVQSHPSAAVTNAFSLNNTAGSLLVCCFRGDPTGIVSDSQGNSWSLAVSQLSDGGVRGWRLWYAPNAKAGANTVTVSNSGGLFVNSIIAEYSGVATSSPLAQTNNTTGADTGLYGPCAVVTTAPNAVVIGCLQTSATGLTDTPSGGFTLRQQDSLKNISLSDNITTISGTITYGGTVVATMTWYADAATFLPLPAAHSISGNAGVAGANITYSGTASGNVTADGSGNYTIPSLADGPYTITPSLAGYTFSPTSASETLAGSNITGVNFTATFVPPIMGSRSTRSK